MPKDTKEKKLLPKDWTKRLQTFNDREWKSAFAWFLSGAFVGILLHVTIADGGALALLQKYLSGHGMSRTRALPYAHHLEAFALIFIVIVASLATPLVRRAFRSWVVGCVSGIPLWFGLCAATLFLQPIGITSTTILVCLLAMILFSALSFVLSLKAVSPTQRHLEEIDFGFERDKASERTWHRASDEPIRSWSEDFLNRAPIVDIITNKALIGEAQVIALSGQLGIGKTSVLNLLQKHLEDKAIVVRFVTWLPGSQDVLSSYLFADIATECEKRYVVPGLRRSARRVARALAETVPTLKGLVEFIPASTQRDDIRALASALERLPQRVVVLLDELDRMEKEEVLTLMKMLRGLADLPNCTFVCALDLDELKKTVRGKDDQTAHTYFEKFFPITVSLPSLDKATLQKFGVQRLVESFQAKSWFADEAAAKDFETKLTEHWGDMVAPLCSTLRAIGLLATNIDISASLLRQQVDPLDLTLIEVLRRFRTEIYSLVARNKLALTGGVSWHRGGSYVSDNRQKREEALFKENFDAALDPNDAEAVRSILSHLFPKFVSVDDNLGLRQRPTEDNDQSISDPEMFSAYFQYEVPEGIFSSLEMDEFLRRFRSELDGYGREQVFTKALGDLPKQSLRRDDFLRKLSLVTKEASKTEAKRLALTAVREAKEYSYDMFAGFGEAGHVTRIVIRAAEKMDHDERVSFLSQCIDEANDDTLAVRILTRLTDSNSDVRLGVVQEELRPAFISRMRRQYGPSADAAMDLSTSDPDGFRTWGWLPADADKDTEDRRIQRDFWLRRIGQSRKTLAQVFNTFLMPSRYHYPNDPAPIVEMNLPLSDLDRLVKQLPDTEEYDADEQRAFDRMQRLLAGEFKNGVPMNEIG